MIFHDFFKALIMLAVLGNGSCQAIRVGLHWPNGEIDYVEAAPTDTIGKLLRIDDAYENCWRVDRADGSRLDRSATVEQCKLRDQELLKAIFCKNFSLEVRGLRNESYEMMHGITDTVATIKRRIAALVKMPIDTFRLVANSHELSDTQKMIEEVPAVSKVYVLLRLRNFS